MNTNLKEGFKVILFDANTFSYSELYKLSDWLKLRTAENYPDCTTIYDSLDEFQEAFNDDSIDEVNNYIFFVQNITPASLDSIKQTYQKEDNCMAELLASEPADGLSIEEAFELYIQAKNWADGDSFFTQTDRKEMTAITSDAIIERKNRKALIALMERAYDSFWKRNNHAPLYADCEIRFKDDGTTTQITITMDSAEHKNDSFYYCNSFDGLKGLTEPDNCTDFIVTSFFGFDN